MSASLSLYDALSQRRDYGKRVIIRCVREQVRPGFERRFDRKQARFFVAASLVALALRLLLVVRFPAIVDDSRLYGDIARNWLQHGVYGITNSGVIMPTLSRLPGYPAFLAAIFTLFGIDNFRAVLLVQVLFDLATCLLIADMARRLFSYRAAQAGFLLAAFCPFLANYGAAALTETLEIFFTTLALDLTFRGLEIGGAATYPSLVWAGCGLSIGASILLRPDGGILLAAIGGYLLWMLLRSLQSSHEEGASGMTPRRVVAAGVLVATCAIALLIPWTLPEPSYSPPVPASCAALRQRLRRTRDEGIQSLGQDLDGGLRLGGGDLLERPRAGHRRRPLAQARLRSSASSANDHPVVRRLQPRSRHDFRTRCPLRSPGAGAHSRGAATVLRMASGRTHRRHVAASADRTVPLRPTLVGVQRRQPHLLAVSLGFGLVNLLYVAMAFAGLWRSPRIFWHRPIRFISAAAFLISRQPGKSRAAYTLECYPVVIVLASAFFPKPV